MLYGDYNELVREANRLSESTEEVIQLIHRLVDIALALLGDNNDQVHGGVDIYHNAICILEDVLRTNDMLREAAEAYMCCSSAPSFLIKFGLHSQKTDHNENEIKEIGGAVAKQAAERRKALAEALRTGQPVMVDSDGTVVVNADKSADLNTQINVSGSDATCSDSTFEGIAVPSGKLAGGMPSRCRICDNVVFSGANYCPYCGTPVSEGKPFVKLHKVQFSAIAPKVMTKGEYTIINVIMYEESSRYIVDEWISSKDEPAQETRSGVQKVNEGAEIKIVLNSPDLSIEDNIETGIWQGEHLDFSFALQLPSDFKKHGPA